MIKLTMTSFDISRRKMLIGGACTVASLPVTTMATTANQANVSTKNRNKGDHVCFGGRELVMPNNRLPAT